MEHLLNPDIATYVGMLAGGCAVLAIAFIVRFVQFARANQPNRVHALMAVGAIVIAGHVLITADVMHNYYLKIRQDTGTPFVLWLLAEAAFISLGMAAYYLKRDVSMTTVCATPFLAASVLFAAYLAIGAGVPWASLLFDIAKYVALVPLALAAVLRMVLVRRRRALSGQ